MNYLLDTNVVSEIRKVRAGKANPNVVRWTDSVSSGTLYISVITVEELEIGTLLVERRDPVQGSVLRRWLEQHVLPAFASRTLSIDVAVARRAAGLHVPNVRPVRDALIAATALVHGMTVVTRNTMDFTEMGVPLLNPWD